ncbi:MAG: hypothetical protein HC883_03395 [Bdellovibrionaceae bacterium]|nr:hypothetical protein [Pseudobdellovibrionaceae bacterium]
MTNQEVVMKLNEAIQSERLKTNEVLQLIRIALDRTIYLELGYPSMFDWLVRGFKYSESSAYRRIEAARVLQCVPDAAEKLASGDLNLTTLTKANSVFRALDKSRKQKVTAADKAEVLQKIEGKSKIETEQTLFILFPEAAANVKNERLTTVDANTARLAVNLSDEVVKDLARIRDLLAPVYPDASYQQIIGRIAKEYLNRKDPLRKEIKPRAPVKPARTA